MLKTALKTTTALALTATLATPPTFAQDNATAELPLCAVTGPFPCVLEDGTRIKNARQYAKKRAGEAIDAMTDEAADETSDAPAEDQATETPAEDGAATAAEAEADTAPVPTDEVAPEETVQKEVAPEEAAPAPETTVEAPAADSAVTEVAPAAEEDTAEAPDAAPAEVAPPAKKKKDRTAPPAAAASAAAETDDAALAEAEAGDDADVTVETVTEDTSRSSDEDFATAVGATGGTAADVAPAGAEARKGGNDDFAKALAIGLGALAVGAILANGARVVSNSGDRVVVENTDGELQVLKNDDEILRRPGSEVRTRTYDDGSTRTVVTREDGVQIATVRGPDGTALKRVRIMPDGRRYVLFDDTEVAAPVEVTPAEPAAQAIEATDSDALRAALIASMADRAGRRYALAQVREYPSVRDLAPQIEVRAITFPTNSAAIPPKQAERLADLGLAIADVIAEVPDAVFLVEGHTDAIGSDSYNLALSDRRAESVALALAEYFDVPPENLVTQGYGESDLAVETQEAERANRRVVVRNITPLLR
ncbi:MAG: OmpA family protein [Paracoccaceae bacterium]